MMYEVEAIKNNSLHIENNLVVALDGAVANKLGLDYSKVYDPEHGKLVHETLKPLYDLVDRLAWRIEYLFRAIQNSTEGKVLTEKGAYLNAEYHKYLTTDGRIMAPKCRFKRDTNSLSLLDDKGKTIAWTHLPFEDAVDLRDRLSYSIKMNLEDLKSNILESEREIIAGKSGDDILSAEDIKEQNAELVDQKKMLEAWQKLVDDKFKA